MNRDTEAIELATLVKSMREAQRSYFRGRNYFQDRSRENLVKAKMLESKVDKLCEQILQGGGE